MLRRLPANRVTRHLLFWAGIIAFQMGVDMADIRFHTNDQSSYLTDFFFMLVPVTLVYGYAVAYGLLPRLMRRQFGQFGGGLLLLTLLAWGLYDVLNGILNYLIIPILANQPKAFILKEVASWQIFNPNFVSAPLFKINMIAGFLVGARLFSQWYQKQRESQELERQKLQTELKLLKLQLNPAFLFGSLSTLHHLAHQQSRQAPEVVLKLAHFLRYVLYESQADRVPLDWEVEVIEQYVFLQRSIHPQQLEVSLTVRGNLTDQTIAPLLLFPIVEHAFRQLPAELARQQPDEPAWVSIDLSVSETHLMLKVIHGQAIAQPDDVVWLTTMHKQFHFYYANSFDLKVRSEPDTHIVSLMIPLSIETNGLATQPLPENGLTTSVVRPL